MPKLCFTRDLGVVALLLADDGDRAAAETRQAGHDRLVLAEKTVARERREIVEQAPRRNRRNAAAAGWRATCVFCHGVRRA